MGLQTIQYMFFLAVVAGVYLHLPRRAQPVLLLAASWVFYALTAGEDESMSERMAQVIDHLFADIRQQD